MLRRLGPSLILTANIVGSGELIVTTTLGAQAGYVTLWVVLVSCAVKVAVQLEFGKHAISSGETTLLAFNKLPGPRPRGVSWSLWIWFIVKAIQLIQFGAIVGGVALAMNLAFPGIGVAVWAWAAGLSTALLVSHGKYRFIERTSIWLTATFSLFTVFCVGMLRFTPYSVSFEDLAGGMTFQLPDFAIGIAVAAFGLTGVSADEIITYPYWCIEKGYSVWTGPREASEDWARRAKGWIRVMYVDAAVSMVIYSLATAAFYILGAAVLHDSGQIPAGNEMIRTLSQIYTETIGPGAMAIFLAGAVIVLFSTLFVACASATRMFTDAFAQFGVLDYDDEPTRTRWFKALAWLLPTIWTLLYLTLQVPILMLAAGGIATAALLLLVVFAAYVFRYHRLAPELHPGKLYDVFFWLSIVAIVGVGLRSIAGLL